MTCYVPPVELPFEVSRTLPRLAVGLVCLLGSAAVAQPRPTSAPLPEVLVARDFLTVLEFDAPLAIRSVTLEGHKERFALVEVSARTVVLRPSVPLAEGERLLLHMGFADGQVPARATLALVPAGNEVDAQVRVVRRPRSPQSLEAELQAVRARCEADSFLQLVLAGMMEQGVIREAIARWHANGTMKVSEAFLYRAQTQAVVALHLRLQAGERAWIPEEAWLLDVTGRVVRRLRVWTEGAALHAREQRAFAVALELSAEMAGQRWTLELRVVQQLGTGGYGAVYQVEEVNHPGEFQASSSRFITMTSAPSARWPC
jgi:uncharacterized protein (TIGR02268 family)